LSYKYIDIRPNPVTGIGSYQRGLSIKDFVDLPQVEHRRIGGPYKATFRIYANDRNFAEDMLFLGVGREVKIYNDKGIVDFGGMIYVVTLNTGGSKVRASLLETSNRVWARWQEAGTANPPDRSTVFDNTASQSLYGIKEEVWNSGQQVSVAEASQYAEKQLLEYAWPTPRAIQISPGKKLADRPILDFVCHGWWHTLSHVRYNQTAVAGGVGASVLVNTIVSDAEIGQFIRNIEIETNITQIEQTIDADMGADAIIKSIVDMGDVGLKNWVAGVDHTREFYYRPGARRD
jgi:hypothetical protein